MGGASLDSLVGVTWKIVQPFSATHRACTVCVAVQKKKTKEEKIVSAIQKINLPKDDRRTYM